MTRLKWLAVASAAVVAISSPVAADAAVIGIYGSNSNADIAAFLTANGHTVAQNMSTVVGANYAGLDAVILLRTPGNAATASFVQNGGRLISEWDAASWVLGAGNLLNADDSYDGTFNTNTTVTFTASGLSAGVGAGIGGSYSAGASSEFFRNISNIGAGVEVWGTRPAGASIIAGAYGSGFVIVNAADWADSFSASGAQNQRLLLNFLGANAAPGGVPEPATWAMMMLGFGAIGFAMRRRTSVTARIRFA